MTIFISFERVLRNIQKILLLNTKKKCFLSLSLLGPAYNFVTVVNKQVYVIAKGRFDDLIASYEFKIHVGGEYSIWLLAYGTSTRDNSLRFRIDNLDIYLWDTTFIENGRPMWTQYMYEVGNNDLSLVFYS
jgi:hypothetical protein